MQQRALKALGFALGLVACAPDPSSTLAEAPDPAACTNVEVLANFPNGSFLENLIVEPDGRVLIANYTGRAIEAYQPGGAVGRFASLPALPMNLLAIPDGYVVVAHGSSFKDGPAFLHTNQIFVLDSSGALTRTIPTPEARFLNGMAALPDGRILIADSVLGRIWQFDVASGALTTWFEAPEYAAREGEPIPGVNGLNLENGRLYSTNSTTGAVVSVAVNAQGEAEGAVRFEAYPGGADDFVVGADGDFIVATHADTVVRSRGAETGLVLPSGGEGATSVAYTNDTKTAIYVITSGWYVRGNSTAEAHLLRVDLPGGPRPCVFR